MKNPHALVQSNGRGAAVLVVQSAKDDNKRAGILRRMATAAGQLDKHSAGAVVAGLDALTVHELQDLSAQDRDHRNVPTVLRLAASDFLREAGEHVVGVVWLSRSQLFAQSGGVSNRGVAYWFPQETSPFWDDAFKRAFRGGDEADD